MRSNSTFSIFKNQALKKPGLNWYAIADNAQQKNLHNLLKSRYSRARCLFGSSDGSPVAQFSPHLVELVEPVEKDDSWSWISNNAMLKPCISIFSTDQDFMWTYDKLVDLAEVELPDRECMYFAFWDPAILGALVGQEDDLTLHVKGPVLSCEQKKHLVFGLEGWWYWSRDEKLHEVNLGEKGGVCGGKLILSQTQVDELLEASVPDHILYFLSRYQPALICSIPISKKYDFVRGALNRGRAIGLESMGDLVSYICAELFYKNKMHSDPGICRALEQVRLKRMTLTAAFMEFS